MLSENSMHPFKIIFVGRRSMVCLISVGEVLHELRAFIHRRIGDVGIVQFAFELVKRLVMCLVHPFFDTGKHLRDNFCPVCIDGTTHLYGIGSREQTFDNIFPIVHSGRGSDTDSGYLA